MDSSTAGPTMDEAGTPPPPKARRGVLVMVSYLSLQLGASVLIGMVLGIVFAAKGGNPANRAAFQAFIHSWSPLVTLAALIISACLVFVWLYRKVTSSDDGFSFAFLRLVPITGRELALAVGIGIAIGLIYLAVTALFGPKKLPTTLGPISTLSTEKGAAFFIWISLGLLAPFIEEVLFRGVLLQSFLASWPRPPASIVAATITGLLFIAMHLEEIVPVPIALVGIGGLAAATTVYAMKRTVTGSIGIHLAYNLVVILSVIAARLNAGNGLLH